MGFRSEIASLGPTSEYMTDQSVIYNKIADLASPNFPPELYSQRPVIRPRSGAFDSVGHRFIGGLERVVAGLD